jgi:DNA invertase Pin-like site-specific DNA recombinase
VVAKLDRLSRNVHFISALMEERVTFLVAEQGPRVPSFLLHVYAAFAEEERRMISERQAFDAIAKTLPLGWVR